MRRWLKEFWGCGFLFWKGCSRFWFFSLRAVWASRLDWRYVNGLRAAYMQGVRGYWSVYKRSVRRKGKIAKV
jgi:hypothetical protein